MAGDWIKIRKDLIDDPAVLWMANEMKCSREEVVGLLVRFWSWVDSHITNGNAANVTFVTLMYAICNEGFINALQKVGWLEFKNDKIYIPKFERHLAHSAKNRALIAERVKRFRRNAANVTKALPEKRRDDDDDDDDDSSLEDGDDSRTIRLLDESSSDESSLPGFSPPKQEKQEDGKILGQHVAYWNEQVAPVLKAPTVRILSDRRLRCLRKRLEEHPNLWQEILDEFPRLEEKFRRGASWINFDFFMSPDRLARYLDGNYRPRGSV